MSEMKYGVIKGLEKPVSRLVHGTIMLSSSEMEKSYQLLDDMYAVGINTFDTAAVYGCEGEAVLLRWVAERNIHDKVVIISKCAHPNQWRKRVTPYDIKYDIADSMAKSDTDYIDIYMLHRDDPEVSVGPIVETLNELKAQKKIITFGASNWEYQRIQEANEYADKHGLESFSSISPHYSLGEQVQNPWGDGCVTLTGEANKTAREIYKENQMPIFSYSTLGRGLFSGAFQADDMEKAKQIMDPPAQLGYLYDCNIERLRRVEILAKEKGVSVPCLALAWVLQQPLNVFTLIGAMNQEMMLENMKAFDVEMTEQQLKWLNLDLD